MRSLTFRRAVPSLPLRRDPAPSRLTYRMHRLWLTPLFRRLMRLGLPVFVLTFAVGIYLSDEGRRAGLTETVAALRSEVKNRPEFMVSLLAVEGAEAEVAETVRQALALPLPVSSFDLDLDAARARVEAIPAVRAASIRVQPGGILKVAIEAREPAAVWRGPEGLFLLDAEGKRTAPLGARLERPDLPLIVGEGADRAVAEALQLIAAAGPLLPRLRGLARVSERRWDLVLDRNQRILLPADRPVRALERLIAIDEAQGLLARDILAVDLRLPERPALRLTEYALTDMRRQRGLIPSETDL